MHGNTNMAWSSSLCRLRAGTEFIGTGSQKEQVWPEELWQSNQLFPAAEQEEDLFIVNAFALWYWSDGTLDIYTKDGMAHEPCSLIWERNQPGSRWSWTNARRVHQPLSLKTVACYCLKQRLWRQWNWTKNGERIRFYWYFFALLILVITCPDW